MYNMVASHLAKRLEKLSGSHPIVVSTEGSDENLTRLLVGQVELAMLQESSVSSPKISVVAPLYYETLHLLVRANRNIDSVSGLRGRAVSIGPVHSGTRNAARLILRQFQLEESDIVAREEEYSSLDQSKDVDAAFVMIKTGVPTIGNLLNSRQWKLIPIDRSLEISLDEPAFRATEILPSDYPQGGLERPIASLATTAFLAARSDAPSRLIEVALQSLYEDGTAIPGILSADRAAHWKGLPWHPAARAFFEKTTSTRSR